jgi:hypothetical protein
MSFNPLRPQQSSAVPASAGNIAALRKDKAQLRAKSRPN